MQMIPFYSNPSPLYSGSSGLAAIPFDPVNMIDFNEISALHDACDFKLNDEPEEIDEAIYEEYEPDLSNLHNELHKETFVLHDGLYGKEISKFLLHDVPCKLSGCNPECAKTHRIDHSHMDTPFEPHVWKPYVNCTANDIQPYTPDSDHCYYASANKQISDDQKIDVLKNIPTPPSTSDSPSESSGDEVDVVTVSEDLLPPVVITRFEVPCRVRPQRNTRKTQRTQNTLSAKSLKAAMKRTRSQSVRKTYKRRKVYNSVETTPSSSMPSSSQSSRCNSDVEDVDKRENHNCSERKRREAQRTALQTLRVSVPELESNPKAPKVLILNTATTFIKKLEHNERTLSKIQLKERQKKSDLIAKLNKLRLQVNMPFIKV